MEKMYIISQENLNQVLISLSQLTYKDVHTPMYILENLKELIIKEDDNESELVEG